MIIDLFALSDMPASFPVADKYLMDERNYNGILRAVVSYGAYLGTMWH